jgi:hypothetical protein
MRNQLFVSSLSILAAVALPLSAQTAQRRATIVGGGSRDGGKCTIEVVVDGAAEVEIRGDTAFLRNLKGQTPQWRRFECTGVMPPNPGDFRFAGVDGRGNQRLVRDPRNGGAAVVQIQDSGNGSEGYTFDIFWGNRIQSRGPDYREPGFRDTGRREFTQDDAIRSCQDMVRREASDRFNARDITFRRFDANDNPGGRDSVRGWFDAHRGYGRDEAFRYSCAVNFESGRVWNAQVEPAGDRRDSARGGNAADRAIDSCRRAVENRITRDGFGNPRIDSIRVDDRPGRQDWVVGNARADLRSGHREFTFSCSVDLRDGNVRSVDVQAR